MKKLLVAENDRTLSEIYRIIFEAEGYNVISAADGREALETIDRERPDAVILDLRMPVIDGRGVLRGLGDYPGGVLVVTADRVERSEFLAYVQVKEVYRKPVDRDTLVNAVRKILDNNQASEL